MVDAPVSRLGNQLADALPWSEREWIAAAARRVFVRRGTVLVDEGQSSPFIYFPVDALLASWNRYEGLARVACSDMAGKRRAAAYSRAMHWRANEGRLQVAWSGEVWRLPYESFEVHASANDHPLRAAIARLAVATSTINAVRSYCAAEHNVRQRVTTFLLGLRAERGSNEVPVTHETIGAMLSIRRPSVSEVLADLQRSQLIRTNHGHLTFVGGDELERIACPCNRTISNILERVGWD